MTAEEAEKLIKADGWYFDHARGSHRHYKHPTKKGMVTIPFHKKPKDLPPKTLSSIRKQAGLK